MDGYNEICSYVTSKHPDRRFQSSEEIALEMIDTLKIQALVDEAMQVASSMTSDEFQKHRETLARYIESDVTFRNVTSNDKQVLYGYITDCMQKEKGAMQEMLSIQSYQNISGKRIKENSNNAVFYKKLLGTISSDVRVDDNDNDGETINGTSTANNNTNTTQYMSRDYYVGGRIDGLTNDGKLIETKNRISGFKTPIPKYDRVQLQTYLQLLDLDEGILIERVTKNKNSRTSNSVSNNDDSNMNMNGVPGPQSDDTSSVSHPHESLKQTTFRRDNRIWNLQLLPALYMFSATMHAVLANKDIQYKYMVANQEQQKLQVLRNVWSTILKKWPPTIPSNVEQQQASPITNSAASRVFQ
jgi:hypothetical protein